MTLTPKQLDEAKAAARRYNRARLDYHFATFQTYTEKDGYKVDRRVKTVKTVSRQSLRNCGSNVLRVEHPSAPENGKYVVVDIDNNNEILAVYDTLEEARETIRETIAELAQ